MTSSYVIHRKSPGIATATVWLAVSGTLLMAGCASPADAHPASRHAPPVQNSVKRFLDRVANQTKLHAPRENTPPGRVSYQDIEYYSYVTNAFTAHGFTLFGLSDRNVVVLPSSAARIEEHAMRPLKFTSKAEQARWVAAGRPTLPRMDSTIHVEIIPPGKFGFMPQGTTLTYAQITSTRPSSQGVLTVVEGHLRPYTAGKRPSSRLMLAELGYLLATAPRTLSLETALWRAIASLPRLQLCGSQKDYLGRTGIGICAGTQQQTELLIATKPLEVLAVEQRILRRSPWYPGISPGTVVESDTFAPYHASL